MRYASTRRGARSEAFGLPTLPASAALGSAFLSTSGLRLTWRQFMPDRTEQPWSLSEPRIDTGFKPALSGKDASARDIAVLVSVADNTELLFAAYQRNYPRCAHWFTSPSPGAIRTGSVRRGKPPTLRMLFRTECGRRGAITEISELCTSSWPYRLASRCS